jgi:hypothetical protein
MSVRGVIGHHIDDDPKTHFASGNKQGFSTVKSAEKRMDIAVVGDVVAAVNEW